MAAQCDETAHLSARERQARASTKLVQPDRLCEAVARYLDWEAFAYWARPALERESRLPAKVASILDSRCPGFLNASIKARQRDSVSDSQPLQRLMLWIADHCFQDAQTEGWFDAILVHVPRKSSTSGLQLIGWISVSRCDCGRADFHMPEVHVARNLPSAGAGPNHQRMLLCARDTTATVSGIRYAVLA